MLIVYGLVELIIETSHSTKDYLIVDIHIHHTCQCSMNAIFICVIVLDLMCFHMLNPCWSNIKRFLIVLAVFGKSFFLQNVKNSVALFWRLNRGLVLSHVPVASPHRDFSRLTDGSMSLLQKYLEYFSKFGFLTFLATQSGDFFAGGGSSREGYIKIFAVYLATPSQVELPLAKNT